MSILKAENVERLFNSETSESILIGSFSAFKPTKTNCIIFITCLIPSIIMGISQDTINLMIDTVGDVLNVMLALFGIVFTGYAFFQALINKQLLILMINNESAKGKGGGKVSKLQETNTNFVELMMLYIISIIISLFTKVIINSISKDFLLSQYLYANNIIAILLIQIYLVFISIIIWRMISFVFNIFQLFNAHAGAKALAIIKDEEE